MRSSVFRPLGFAPLLLLAAGAFAAQGPLPPVAPVAPVPPVTLPQGPGHQDAGRGRAGTRLPLPLPPGRAHGRAGVPAVRPSAAPATLGGLARHRGRARRLPSRRAQQHRQALRRSRRPPRRGARPRHHRDRRLPGARARRAAAHSGLPAPGDAVGDLHPPARSRHARDPGRTDAPARPAASGDDRGRARPAREPGQARRRRRF